MAAKFVTKDMLDEAVDAILKGVDNLIGTLRNEFNSRFDDLKADNTFIKRELDGLKATLKPKSTNLLRTSVLTASKIV